MIDWHQQRILLTGGAGFLGRAVANELRARGAASILIPRSTKHDLRRAETSRDLLTEFGPTLIIHAAATVGGIGANRANPATYFYDNLMMGIQLLEAARLVMTPKVVVIGTVCSYPRVTPVPFREENLWDGYPEGTNAPYGIAKKALLVQGQAFREQYGLNSIHLIPVNLYGPGDNYESKSSHVIPAIIEKCLEAIDRGEDEITLWGSGSATRAFLFVEDAARGIVDAAERYNGGEPINLGSEVEISIRELAEKIAERTGYKGRVNWDSSMPDGQPRRSVSSEKARSAFGWSPSTTLDDGLARTIEDRLQQRGT
jgi:GDP-L-fucose synthase